MDTDDVSRSPTRWRRAALVVVLVLGLAGTVLFPSPASADGSGVRYWNTNPDGVIGVSATGHAVSSYASDGYTIRCEVHGRIHDTRGDGYRVGVQIRYYNGGRKYHRIYHVGGVGTSRTFDLTKYTQINAYIREFIAEGTDIVTYGDWQRPMCFQP